jgi:hypothetical protein
LQTSKRLPLVPLDIFYPAQSGSPLLPVTLRSSRSDYALRRNPFRGNCTKVNLKAGPVSGRARDRLRRQSSPRSFPVSLWMK